MRAKSAAGSASNGAGSSVVRSDKLAPAQKTGPVLVTTTTRTESFASAMSSASWNSVTNAELRALRFASSIKVMVQTARSSVVSTAVPMVSFLSAHVG